MATTKYNESDFPTRLKMLRGDRSQGEFATFLGINSQQTYANYENGRVPKMPILQQISQRCGVSLEWLLGTPESKNNISESVVREEPAVYGAKPPALDPNSPFYASLLATLIPKLGITELMDTLEALHSSKPAGWEDLASQAFALLKQKLPPSTPP
jgi:transcriptional regulator with XRE-family HTH domain